MQNSIEYQTPAKDYHGMDTIARMQENKRIFDAAGTRGRISFVKACIASGINELHDIVDEAIRVTGSHIIPQMETTIIGCEDIFWQTGFDGKLELFLHPND